MPLREQIEMTHRVQGAPEFPIQISLELEVLWSTYQTHAHEILNSTIWVIKAGTHSSYNILSWKAHTIRNCIDGTLERRAR